MMHATILGDLVVLLAAALVVVAGLSRLKLPPIAGFIVAGAIVGPNALGLIGDIHEVELLAEIGVVLLLFEIGLEVSLGRMRPLLRLILLGGVLQMGLTIALTMGAARAFHLPAPTATFLGLVFAVSSTAVVLRGLTARGELAAPHGRLTVGILIFQDLSVVPMMLALPFLAGNAASAADAGWAMGRTVLTLAALFAGARFVLPRLLHFAARTRERELFVLAVILVSVGAAWMFSASGVSLALGAFLAGLVVAGSEYRHQALSDLLPFREVFSSLFFIATGMLLDPYRFLLSPGTILALLAAILVGKFLIVFSVALLLRLPLRVAVLSGAALAQVGEFSFVLIQAARGTSLWGGALAEKLTAAIILSLLVTPLLLAVGPRLAVGMGRLRPLTRLLRVREAAEAPGDDAVLRDHVIVAGYGLAGRSIARTLHDLGHRYVVLELNAENVRRANRELEPAFYGDVTSADVLARLGLTRARVLVVAVNDPTAAIRAVRAARRLSRAVPILVRTSYVADVDALREAGATEVVVGEVETAVELSRRVLRRFDAGSGTMIEEANRIREECACDFGEATGGREET